MTDVTFCSDNIQNYIFCSGNNTMTWGKLPVSPPEIVSLYPIPFFGETVDATHAIIHSFPCQWVLAGRLGLLEPLEPDTQATFFLLCLLRNTQKLLF